MSIHRIGSLAAAGAVLLVAAPAWAQGWQEYDYPEAGFAAQFPVKPTVAELQYRAPGLTAPAKVYTARQGSADFSVTVADLSGVDPGKDAAIAAATAAFAGTGEIKLDVNARIDRQFGHELSIQGKDGGRTVTAIFYIDKKLYILAARTDADGSGLGVRFQQTLQFIGADGRPPRRPEDGPAFGGPGFRGRGFGPPPGEVAQNDQAQNNGSGGEAGGFRRRRRPPPEAFTACQGKAAGDAVQFQTPRGDAVAATCVQAQDGLAARPNRRGPPPDGAAPGGAPPSGPPPEG